MSLQLDRTYLLAYGVPVLIILFSVFLALSPLLGNYPELAIGITYDLTLTAPLVYFILIRKKKIPKITVVPFFILGIILATLLLPEEQRFHVGLVKSFLLPIVELGVLSVILYRVYAAIKAFKANASKYHTYDFYLILKESTAQVMDNSKISKIFSSEIAMVYYAIFSWRKKQSSENSFTNYKESGITALFAVIILIILVETGVVHLLVTRWNELIAWVLTLSSVYAGIQILAHIKALRQRPSEIIGREVYLKNGLFGDMKVDVAEIERVELSSKNVEDKNKKVEQFALLKEIEAHNVVIYFNKEQKIETAYGMTKKCDVLLLQIDNKQEFVNKINAVKQQHTV